MMSFRRRIFLAAFSAAFATVVAATALVSWSVRRDLVARLERTLVSEAQLAAELMRHQAAVPDAALDEEADTIGRRIAARVTLIASDGSVLGDSERDGPDLAAMENHGARPEVVAALRSGTGISTRHSTTIDTNMLYVAVPVSHENSRVSVVRLALPLTDVREQLGTVRRLSLLALGVGALTALALAWWTSLLVSRRVSAIAAVASRYASGDYSPGPADYGPDELGTVARVLDESVQNLRNRLAELARDRALTAGILSGMAEGVIVVGARGQVQLVNAAAKHMLGLADATRERHYLEAVRHPGIAGQIGAALNGEEPKPVEVTLGTDVNRLFIARGTPVEAPGGRIAVVVLHDVSDLKRADRVRRDFVANVSHELRTPLTAIRGYVEALMDGPDNAEDTKRFLGIIARHTSRMERLVRDLLRLAHLEAGHERLDKVPVRAGQLFEDVASSLAPFIDERGQQVRIDIEPGAERLVVDPARFQDVLRNLVENASNYSPEGTTITLRSKRRDGQAAIEVADEGPGIPEADLNRVFERFYRVDKARARHQTEAGGTGLGLAIVKHLVGLHGGTVAARNAERGGAVFTVVLPDA